MDVDRLYCPHIFKRFTIRGSCAECAPDLHRDYEAKSEAFRRATDEYRTATGQEPLSDWYAFERWIEAQSKGAA